MKKLVSLITVLPFICLPNKSFAQFITDGAGVAVTLHAKSGFKKSEDITSFTENKFEYNTYDYWLPIPPFKMGKIRILGTINYRTIDFQFDGDEVQSNTISKIQEIKPTIVIRRPLGKRVSAFGIFIPTIASDFKGSFSSEDLILDGVFGVSRKFGEKSNLEIGIGPHILYAFGKFLLTPAISIDYKSNNKKWMAQLYWPRVNVFRNLGTSTQLGLAGSIDWTLYNLKNRKNNTAEEIDYAQFSAIHGGIQMNQRLFDRFWLQLQCGAAFTNSYTLYNANNDTISNYKADKSLYVKAMLTYRFSK